MGVIFHILPDLDGLYDLPDVLVREGVLVLARQVVPASINKEYVFSVLIDAAFFPLAVKDQDRHWNRGGREEIPRQTDHGIV